MTPEATPAAPPAASATPASPAKAPEPAKAAAPATPPAAPPAAKADEKKPDAKYFALMARKEKGLVLKAQDQRMREEKLQERQKAVAALEEAQSVAKSNPLRALELLGLTYEDVTATVLNDKKPTADLHVQAVKSELEKFKAEQAEKEKKAAEDARARAGEEAKAQIEAFHRQCIDFVKTNAAEYELISAEDAFDYVPALIQETYTQTKRLLSIKEAADLVEQEIEKTIEKLASTKKWQAKAKAPPSKEPETRPESAQPRTLNNGMTATAQSFASSTVERDRMKRAMAALERSK